MSFDCGGRSDEVKGVALRRSHRSRLFWLGVPGLALMLGAWWDSGGYDSVMHVARGDMDHKVRLQFGSVWWQRTKEWRPDGVRLNEFSVERSPLISSRTGKPRGRKLDLPPAIYRYETSFGGAFFKQDILIVQVGLWAIMAGYIVLWEVMVFCWELRKARVRRRLTEMGAAEVAG